MPSSTMHFSRKEIAEIIAAHLRVKLGAHVEPDDVTFELQEPERPGLAPTLTGAVVRCFR